MCNSLVDNVVIGFIDECSSQTRNTVRLWGLCKPRVVKNTTRIKLNVLGFYALNGQSVVEFKEDSKKATFASFLYDIRRENPLDPIVVILDNYSTHRAGLVRETARLLDITLVYLPPYSPDLNPIELVWKSLKRVLSPVLYHTKEEIKEIIISAFYRLSSSISFAHRWIEKILSSPV